MNLERLELQIGKEKINNIKNKTVLIIGLGGVGGYALESIVRSGVENLIIVDSDIIEETNLNRQLISLYSNIGKYKVDEFEKRIKDINPKAKITKINKFITEKNIDILFNENIDYIVDACDTIKTKEQIIRECIKRNIKLISCMGMGRKIDPTKIQITDIRKTSYDPIAKAIRKMVKDEKIKEKIIVISSTEQPLESKKHISSNSFVPGVAGLMCASYVINDIIGG